MCVLYAVCAVKQQKSLADVENKQRRETVIIIQLNAAARATDSIIHPFTAAEKHSAHAYTLHTHSSSHIYMYVKWY